MAVNRNIDTIELFYYVTFMTSRSMLVYSCTHCSNYEYGEAISIRPETPTGCKMVIFREALDDPGCRSVSIISRPSCEHCTNGGTPDQIPHQLHCHHHSSPLFLTF